MTVWISIAILVTLIIVLWWVWPTPLARLFQWADRRIGNLRSRRKRCGDIDWHYLEGGCGEPLVLLHGFNADAHHFCRVAQHLSAHFRILSPDLPGFGDTRLQGGQSFRIDDLADRVLEWLDEMNIHHFYLGGNSMGGYIATAMARRAPDRVRALWLLAPGGLREARNSVVFEEIAGERHNPLIIRNLADFRRLLDFCFVRPPWIPTPLQRFLTRRAAADAARAQRVFDDMRFDSTPLEDIARGLPTPSLVTWGQADQVLHPSGAAALEQLMPNCQTMVLPGIGHLPMLESPRTVAEAWLGYAESCARNETAA